VSKTLLAVDDSATMRKVLEITFIGEDFNVVVAEGHQSALGKLADEPAVCVIDTALGSDDGYALAKEIRKRKPGVAIVMVSSRYNPYDAAKGKDAGADDFMDKPFDTQQMIDKVRKAMVARGAAPEAVAPAARPAAAATHPNVPAAAAPARGGAAGLRQRSATLMFGSDPGPERAPSHGPAAAASKGSVPKMAAVAPAASPAAPAVAGAVNGHLAGKLGELGLSPAQADAVLALSREVVEKVVWEVVPQLAEAIIKEEIARLTKER
jgi:CheY-like chemotaxis protein